MDIKFHVNKIIKSGGDVDDWFDLIAQLKNIRTDRDLLMQIYKVALKNLKKEATVGYKKLMIGLANLQSEVSLDVARETYLDAKALDLECAVVCVYYAQFEYLHQRKDKARQIINAAMINGCFPKYILKQAYQNWRQNKLNLLDGINDPWNSLLCDGSDYTKTGGNQQVHDTTANKASQVFGTTQVNHSRTVTTGLKAKALPPPTRAINKPFERHGPGMSPFMKVKYSPLVKRKFDLSTMDDGIFSELYLSSEKCPFIDPIKNLSSSEFGSENDGSSDSCTSGIFTTNILKESNSHLQKRDIKKSISSPCISQGNRSTISEVEVNFVSDSNIENVSKMCSGIKAENSMNSEEKMHHQTVQENINVLDNDPKDIFYRKKNNSKSDNENNSLINGGGTAFINNNIIDINHSVDTQSSTKIQKSLLSPSQNNVLYRQGKNNSGDERSSLINGVTNSANDTLDVVNDNVRTKSISPIHVYPFSTKTELGDYNVSMNQLKIDSINKITSEQSNSKFQNVFTTTPIEKKAIENKVNGYEVGMKQIPDDTNSTNCVIPKVDKNTNDKISGSDMFSEDSMRTNTDYISDGLASLGRHVYPGKISPLSYTVNGICYHRIRVLGKGGSCKVYEVLSEHGETYALKKVNLHDVDNFMLDMYKNEIKWLEKMKGNRHIIGLFDWEMNGETLFLLLEKGDSDLAHTLRNKKTLPREVMKDYWKQIITAVKVIHDNGIVHTDLKPANFLLVGNMLKLIDFGIANSIQDNKTSVTRECQMGTLNYMSPEALVQDGCRISRASDVWSLGCLLYYMIYKKTPYSHIKNQYSRFIALQEGKPIDYTGIDDNILLDCLQGCLKHDKRERSSIQQLLAHPYLH